MQTTAGPWGRLFGEAGRVVVRHDDDEGAREEQRTRRGRGEALRLRSSADGECEPEVERSSVGRAGTGRMAVQQTVDGSRPAERRGTGAAPRVATAGNGGVPRGKAA